MKAFVTIELEIPFKDEDTKEVDELLEVQNKTFNYHMHEQMEKLLTQDADVPKEVIKSIRINRID
ncbi:hypothetical protein QTG56_25655 (plasmid) [Rossellomorea sp. AcN35-11]|nr:hypothetical protein [Rossellomorea aquimaris]WJV32002.1 hypothetical protein QTG56_25655 [Rossellomorea sp. AcN35-11]